MTRQDQIKRVFDSMRDVVLEKNRRYGDSALTPLGIFSKGTAESNICNRLDDKLSRIKNSPELRKNDISDMIGYLSLYCVSKGWTDFSDQID